MSAGTKNFTIEQNSTWDKLLTWKDSLGALVNLTGKRARMQIRDAKGVLIVDLSTENGKIVLGGAAGTIRLILDVADTKKMSNVPMFYDLKIIEPSGAEHRKLKGKINLSTGQTE